MTTHKSMVASRQAPLRRAYVRDPEQAVTVKCARTVEGSGTDPFHGSVVWEGYPELSCAYGIDAKVGGFDDLPNPGHILCAALAACLDSTIRMIADHLGVGIERLDVQVTGDVDVRGCLAMNHTVRPGFRQMHCDVRLELQADADARLSARVVKQAEQLCVTLDTLRNGVPIAISQHMSMPPAASVPRPTGGERVG